MLRYLTVASVASLLLCSAATAEEWTGDAAAMDAAAAEQVAAIMPGMDIAMPDGGTWTTTVAFLRQSLDAHSAAVTALAVTPDGSTLFTGGRDGHIRIWDLATGDLLQDVHACQAQINDIAISPDSTYVVTAAEDGYVKVWDAVTAELLIALPAHLGGPEAQGAIGRFNQTVRSAKGSAPRYAAERVPAVLSANAVAVSPDSLFFYTAGDDGYVRKYSVEENYTMTYEVFASQYGVNDILLNATGQYLFAGGVDGYVNIFNAELGSMESQILAYENGEVRTLALSNNEACLLTGASTGELRVWDASTGSLVKKVRAHAGDVNWIGFLPDDSMVLSGGADGMFRVWNFAGDKLGELKSHVLALNEALLVDCTIVTGGDDFKVRLWDGNFPGCQVAPVVEQPYVPEDIPYVPDPVEPDEPVVVPGRG
jgi:WD40 repeat protein